MKKIISILLAIMVLGCFGIEAKPAKKSGKKKSLSSSKNSTIAKIVLDNNEPPLLLKANGTIKNFVNGQFYIKDDIYYVSGVPYRWGDTLGIIKGDIYYLIVWEDPDFWDYMHSESESTSIKYMVNNDLVKYDHENNIFYYITSQGIKSINLNYDVPTEYEVLWY